MIFIFCALTLSSGSEGWEGLIWFAVYLVLGFVAHWVWFSSPRTSDILRDGWGLSSQQRMGLRTAGIQQSACVSMLSQQRDLFLLHNQGHWGIPCSPALPLISGPAGIAIVPLSVPPHPYPLGWLERLRISLSSTSAPLGFSFGNTGASLRHFSASPQPLQTSVIKSSYVPLSLCVWVSVVGSWKSGELGSTFPNIPPLLFPQAKAHLW